MKLWYNYKIKNYYSMLVLKNIHFVGDLVTQVESGCEDFWNLLLSELVVEVVAVLFPVWSK